MWHQSPHLGTHLACSKTHKIRERSPCHLHGGSRMKQDQLPQLREAPSPPLYGHCHLLLPGAHRHPRPGLMQLASLPSQGLPLPLQQRRRGLSDGWHWEEADSSATSSAPWLPAPWRGADLLVLPAGAQRQWTRDAATAGAAFGQHSGWNSN